MSIYTYDNTTIVLYSTEDEGLISAPTSPTDDYGSISDAPTNLQAESNLSNDSYGEISISDTNTPFGTVIVSGTKAEAWCPRSYLVTGTATLASTALEGIRKIWAGNGSLFEMGGGMERSSAFWVGSGGLTVSGASVVRTALDWNEDLFVEFKQEDLGLVNAPTSPFLDFGNISDVLTAGELDRGFVYNIGDVRGATSYHKFTNAPWAEFNTYSFTTDRTGSGGLFAASGLSETKTSTEFGDKTTLFDLTGGEIYSQTSREVMSGDASFGSAGVEKYIQDYTDQSGFTLDTADYGSTYYDFLSTEDQGSIAEYKAGGEYDHGGIIWNNVEANTGTYQFVALYDIQGDGTYARYWEGEGSFSFTGNSIGTTTLEHWTGGGSLFSTGGAAECRTDSVIGGETTLFNWSGAYSDLKFQYHWTGSGSLFETGGCSILRTFGYDDTATIGYSTGDWGQVDGPPNQPEENWGSITDGWLSENWWYIWHEGVATSMGGFKVQSDPKVLNDTPENYFDPENPLLDPNIGQNWNTYRFTWGRWLIQGGSLFSAGGAAEARVIQPDEDTALGTLSGAYTGLQATFREIGGGSLSSFEGIAHTERTTFDYNQQSHDIWGAFDWGTIVTLLENEDLGSIDDIQSGGEINWGTIWWNDTSSSGYTNPTIGTTDSNFAGNGVTGFRFGYTWSLTREAWTQEEIDARLAIDEYYVTPETGEVPVAGQEKTQEESGDIRFKPIWGQTGEGSLFSVGGASESATFNPINDTTLFDVFTAPQFVGYTYRYAWSYVGNYTMPTIGGAAESVTFDYSLDSINTYVIDDEGLITDSVTVNADYGDLGVLSAGEEDYGSTEFTETTLAAIGEIETSGSSPSAAVYRDPTQGGSLFTAGGSVESVTFDDYENIVLFTYSTAPQFIGNTYRFCWNAPFVEGGLFSIGGSAEKAAYDYNEQSHDIWSAEDEGLITDSATTLTDLGSVAEIQYGGEEDQGTIWWNDTTSAGYTNPTAGTTDHNFAGNGVSGFHYGVTWSLTRPLWTQEEIDERLYINPLYVTPETGQVPVAGQEKTQEESGHIVYKPIWGQVGSGGLFAVGGAAERVEFKPVNDTALFDIFTAPAYIGNTYRYAWSYVGYYNLPTIGGAAESVTFDYNESSINTYVVDDEGNIVDNATVFGEYGGLGAETQGEADYGSTEFTETTYPLTGTITLTTAPQWVGNTYKFVWRAPAGSGSLFSAGGAAESKTSTELGDSTTLFDIYTAPQFIGNTYRFCWNFVGSGNLPTTQGASECRTYDYNQTSHDIWTAIDEGLITDAASVFDNYGDLGVLTQGIDDYNSIWWNDYTSLGYTNPTAGTTDHNFAGNGVTGFRYGFTTSGASPSAAVYRDPTAGGSLFSAAGAAESVTTTELGDATTLFDLFTAPQFIGDTYRFCWNFVGSGNLPVLSGGSECRTYDYNQTSHDIWSTDDRGLITDSNPTVVNLGSIAEPLSDGEENYGTIWWNDYSSLGYTNPTAGTTDHNFAGNGVTGFRYGFTTSGASPSAAVYRDPTAGGSLFSAGGAAEAATFNDTDDTALFDIFTAPQFIGNTYRFIWNAPPGSGSLFSVGGGVEKVTFDYNEESGISFSSADFGDITVNVPLTPNNPDVISYGSIDEIQYAGEESYGLIVYGAGAIAAGGEITLSLTRASWTQEEIDAKLEIDEFYVTPETGQVPVAGQEKTQEESGDIKYVPIFAQIGEGSLYSIGGAAESKTSTEFGEDTSLGDLSGTHVLSLTVSEIGGGSLFSIGGGSECRTYDYNQTSHDIWSTLDWGADFTTPLHPVNDVIDYGAIADIQSDGEENYGTIWWNDYTSLGYTNPTAGTTDHNFAGNGVTGFRYGYTTSGTGSDAVVFSDPLVGGSLFSAGGAAEKVTFNDYEDIALFEIFTAPQFIGDTYRFCWTAPPVTGGLFSVGGCVEARTYDYNDGSVIPFSTVDYGDITVNVPLTPNNPDVIDIGLISDPIEGGEISYGLVIHTDVVYSVSGGYTISLTRPLWTQAEIDELLGIDPGYVTPETGQVPVAGQEKTQEEAVHVIFKPAYAHIGEGSLFTAGGHSESVLVVPSVDTALFDIFTAPQFIGNTYRFIWTAPPGSGGLFGFGGGAESRTYDYNQQSHDIWSDVDWGLVSDAHNPINDAINYGSVAEIQAEGEENFGTIWWNDTTSAGYTSPTAGTTDHNFAMDGVSGFPYGLTTSGAGSQRFVFGVFSGTGSLFSTGGAGECVTSTEFGEDTSLGDLSGTSILSRTFREIGSGSILRSGFVGEARTYAYNESSSLTFTTDDWDLVQAYAGQIITPFDFGSVHPPQADGEEDWGSVLYTTATDATKGTYTFNGNAVGRFVRAPYQGSGGLFTAGGAAEVVAMDYEAIGLFDIFTAPQFIGNTYSFSWKYTGTGNINTLSGCAESRTWDYSDTLPTTQASADYGLVSNQEIEYATYGDLGALTAGEQDFGEDGTLENLGPAASGTYTISGVALTPFTWRGGCEGGTYTIYGEGLTRPTTTMTGEGGATIFTAPQFIGNTYAFTWGHGFVQSGSLFSAGGAAECTTTNPPEDTLLYTVAGTRISERQTFAESGSGAITLSGVGSALYTGAFEGSGLTRITILSDERRTFGNFNGSGSLFTASGAAETVSFSPEGTGIGTLTGVAGLNVVFNYFGSGSITISGEADVVIARAPYLGSGSITLSGTKAESFTPATEIGSGSIFNIGGASESFTLDYEETYLFNVLGDTHYTFSLRHIGSGSLFTASGAAEAVGTNPPESTVLLAPTGTAIEKHTENYVGSGSTSISGAATGTRYIPHITGSGTATITGEADLIYRVRYFGSGSLFTAGGVAESVTTNPPESTVLLAPTGTGTESRVYGDNIGSGSISLSGAATFTRYIPHITGSGTYTVSGAATFKLRYILTGSGNVFTTVGAAESTTSNPPEDTALFTWSGVSENSWQPVWIGQGSYFTSGQIPEPLITKHWTASGSLFSVGGAAESFSANIDGIGLYDISGVAQTPRARDFVGTGSLWTASGAAEAVGTNPPESTVLFEYAGTRVSEKHVERWVGDSAQYTISGEVTDIQLTKHWTGSGSISLSGTAVERQTDDWAGSGSLFTAGGVAESTTTNPPENTVLYTWTGAGTEKHTERYVGDTAEFTWSGEASVRWIPSWIGSGSLFETGGSVESISTSEFTTGLFTVYGDGDTSRTRPYVGSGSITLSGTSPSSTTYIDQYLQTAHYSISGEATDIKLGWKAEGFYGAFLYGMAPNVPLITRHYTGSGGLFTAGGTAESITTNPPENTTLHKVSGDGHIVITLGYIGSGTVTISGTPERVIYLPNNIGSGSIYTSGIAGEAQTDHYHGSGTATISGDVSATRTFAHEGEGSLFTASGAAESKTVDWETYYLFEVQGTGAEAFIRKGYVGSGVVATISGESSDIKLTYDPDEDAAQYTYSGGVTDVKRTAHWVVPHARLFAFNGAVETATVDYEDTTLYKVNGTVADKFVRAGYIGSGTITLTGESINELRTFEPEYVFAEII